MPRFAPAVLVAALALSACGAEAVPEDVGESTKAAGSARIETVTRFESMGQTHESRTSSVVDYAEDRTEFVVQSSGCRTRLIGDTTYFEVPPYDGLPAGKRWVRYTPDGKSSEQVFEESLEASDSGWEGYAEIHLFVSPAPTPDDYLDYLTELAGELQAVGEEEVRSVATTHYRTTIDTRRKTEHELAEEGWKPANVERYLENLDATTEEVDVWVDAESRVRRVVSTAMHGQGMSQVTTTTEYYDFGQDVEIEPPPAEAVLHQDEWERLTGTIESDAPQSCLH